MKRVRIIGLSGTNGSGKDTVGRLLAERHGYRFVSVSDIIREELKRRKLPATRHNMRQLSSEWRRQFGLGVLVDKALAEFNSGGQKYKGLVLASIRNSGEVDRIHQLGGILVWVDADPEFRYARLSKDLASRGAHRAVTDKISFEEFMADEEAEMHPPAGGDASMLDMANVKQKCDIHLFNNSDSLEELDRAIVVNILDALNG